MENINITPITAEDFSKILKLGFFLKENPLFYFGASDYVFIILSTIESEDKENHREKPWRISLFEKDFFFEANPEIYVKLKEELQYENNFCTGGIYKNVKLDDVEPELKKIVVALGKSNLLKQSESQ